MKRPASVGLGVSIAIVAALAAGVAACSPADVKNTEPAPGDGGVVTDGGGTDVDGEAGAGAGTSCKANAYARCSKLATCSQTYLENRYGTVATCELIMGEECAGTMNAPGSGQTPAEVDGCTAVVPDISWSCADYLLNENTPPACATPAGSLATGVACFVSAQCQSAFCNVPTGSTCGVCAPTLQVHDSCATNNCPANLVCEATTKTCETYSQVGASCSSSEPCAIGLTCTATATGFTCQSSMATLDDPCVFSGPGCNFSAGYSCNIELGTCQQAQIVAPGGTCGQVAGQQAYCSAGICLFGNCVAYGLPGAACSFAPNGASCIAGTRCILTSDGGTSGTCQVIGQGTCQ